MTREERTEAAIWFVQEMLTQLSDNEHKSSWRKDSYKTLRSRLLHELEEMEDELFYDHNKYRLDLRALISECADVANFAMMIADKARQELRESPIRSL